MSGCECRVCGYYHPGEGCVIDDALVSKLARERDEALAEVERLREQLTLLQKFKDAALADQVSFERDAERYRWLRDARDGTDTIYDDDFDLLRGEALDAAIDKVLMEHRNAD